MNPTIIARAATKATRHLGPNYIGIRLAQNVKMIPAWVTALTIFLTWPSAIVYTQKKGLWNM